MLFAHKIFGGEQFSNRFCYYDLMKNYLASSISPTDYSMTYIRQRRIDLKNWKTQSFTLDLLEQYEKNLSAQELEFQELYSDELYSCGHKFLPQYHQSLERYDISGWKLIGDLFNVIDIPSMEFEPGDDPGFDPRSDYNEEQLYEIINGVMLVLEDQKPRWEVDYD